LVLILKNILFTSLDYQLHFGCSGIVQMSAFLSECCFVVCWLMEVALWLAGSWGTETARRTVVNKQRTAQTTSWSTSGAAWIPLYDILWWMICVEKQADKLPVYLGTLSSGS